MLEYSLLHQFLLLFLAHVTLLEVERYISLLYHNRPANLILFLEHSTQNPAIAIILTPLHLFIIKVICQNIQLLITYPSLILSFGFVQNYLQLSQVGKFYRQISWNFNSCNIQIPNFFAMMPNGTSTIQVNKSMFQPISHKFISNTPLNKQHQNPSTAIKRIHNFSYALNDEIGLGLTSRVYKGKSDITGLPVAIKCIDLKNQNDSLNQQLIKEQIAILEKIKSMKTNHLLKLQQVVLTTNNLYIITQFCQGKDVGKILRQKKNLSQSQAQTIMKQMILGYRELYSLGLIHRDLKLSNLFVAHGKVKLADFGFAISEDKCSTSFSYNAGSPKYMPPESLRFNRYSFKSDVWAMGVMAYEMIYGSAPWKDKDDHKLYELTTSVPIENLFDPNVQISDQYKNFIVNCLKPNINQRANPDFIFGFQWPLAQEFVQGFEEQKKIPEVIKVPGKNYAVFHSANEISYESKQLDVDDFANKNSVPAQYTLLGQLNYCRFLMSIFKSLKALNTKSNQLFSVLSQQITLSVQIVMKILGEIACFQKNKLDLPNFQNYIKTGQWQNIKQLLVRYDIQFRNELQTTKLPGKGATIPQTSILAQTISYLKTKFPENARLIDKLITYHEIRPIFTGSMPLHFAQKVNIGAIAKECQVPDSQFNNEAFLNRVVQRLNANGL